MQFFRSKKTVASLTAIIAIAIAGSVSAAGNSNKEKERYLVHFKSSASHSLNEQIGTAGGEVIYNFDNISVKAISLPPQALKGIENNPNVLSVEEDVPRYPFAESVPFGVPQIQADLITGGPDAPMVCIIDSGYYLGHEDLPTTGVTGTNNSASGNWFEDTCGHGSHVAGTIAAVSGNNTGIVGVLPNSHVNLHIVKVFDGASCGWSYSSDLINALNTCVAAGADVVSMSLGGPKGRGPSEGRAFDSAYSQGVLSIAAAGNDGTTTLSYPASYDSVVSVAAIDSNEVVADFSQKNSQVELSAAGVGVVSTLPFKTTSEFNVSGSIYSGQPIENAAEGVASGTLVDGGLCDSTGNWAGAIVLCERGVISFYDKVNNAEVSGADGVMIYNNIAEDLYATLGDGNSSAIPAIGLNQADGQALLASLGLNGTLTSLYEQPASGYAAYNGTSMATPHVSAAAALLWGNFPSASNQDIRDVMGSTAKDLGDAGRDNAYGFGLVQLQAAFDALAGGGTEPPPEPGDITLSATGYKSRGVPMVDLSWSGVSTGNVDIYRNGSLLITTGNSGSYTDNLGKRASGTFEYTVCEEGTSTCSATASVSF